MRKVFIEGFDSSLMSMFTEEGYEVTNDLLEADLLCLEGGADVTPELYGEANTHSGNSVARDIHTFGLMRMADLLGIPKVGICRGSQALCVHEGGSLKQHIEGHGRYHNVVYGDRIIYVSSTHHQESIPPAYAEVSYSEDRTVEVAEYHNTDNGYRANALGCQFHPEYFDKGHECREFFFELVNKVCFQGQ